MQSSFLSFHWYRFVILSQFGFPLATSFLLHQRPDYFLVEGQRSRRNCGSTTASTHHPCLSAFGKNLWGSGREPRERALRTECKVFQNNPSFLCVSGRGENALVRLTYFPTRLFESLPPFVSGLFFTNVYLKRLFCLSRGSFPIFRAFLSALCFCYWICVAGLKKCNETGRKPAWAETVYGAVQNVFSLVFPAWPRNGCGRGGYLRYWSVGLCGTGNETETTSTRKCWEGWLARDGGLLIGWWPDRTG